MEDTNIVSHIGRVRWPRRVRMLSRNFLGSSWPGIHVLVDFIYYNFYIPKLELYVYPAFRLNS